MHVGDAICRFSKFDVVHEGRGEKGFVVRQMFSRWRGGGVLFPFRKEA